MYISSIIQVLILISRSLINHIIQNAIAQGPVVSWGNSSSSLIDIKPSESSKVLIAPLRIAFNACWDIVASTSCPAGCCMLLAYCRNDPSIFLGVGFSSSKWMLIRKLLNRNCLRRSSLCWPHCIDALEKTSYCNPECGPSACLKLLHMCRNYSRRPDFCPLTILSLLTPK